MKRLDELNLKVGSKVTHVLTGKIRTVVSIGDYKVKFLKEGGGYITISKKATTYTLVEERHFFLDGRIYSEEMLKETLKTYNPDDKEIVVREVGPEMSCKLKFSLELK